MLTHKKFCGSTCIQLSFSNFLKIQFSSGRKQFVEAPHANLAWSVIVNHGDGICTISFSPSATYRIFSLIKSIPKLSLYFSFTIVFYFLLFLNFRIPITRNLTILFFLPLLSSTLPKSELCAAITTISTYDHSKVSPSKNEEKSPTAALSVTYTFQDVCSGFSDFWESQTSV